VIEDPKFGPICGGFLLRDRSNSGLSHVASPTPPPGLRIVQWTVIDVLAVSTDLFFASRIQSAARAAGRSVRFVSSLEAAAGLRCRLALVDLDAAIDVPAIIALLKSNGAETVVAFGPHLDTQARKVARAAGADRVLAKSKFVVELPRLLMATSGGTVARE